MLTMAATDTAATTARGPPMLTTVVTDTVTEATDTDTVDTTARGPLRLITDMEDTAGTDTDTATVTAGASKTTRTKRTDPKTDGKIFHNQTLPFAQKCNQSIICHCKPSFLCLKYSNLVPLPCVDIRFQKVGCC